MNIVAAGIVEGLSTRVDGTIRITLGSQEMGSDDAGRLFTLRGKYVKFLVSDQNISTLQAEAVTSVPLASPGKKTPSARFRAVLYRVHEQTKPPVSFDQFYESEMERLIDHYKGKLTP